MSEDLNRIQQRARDLARSGKFIGSRAVAFELQFEPGYAQAFRWIHSLERKTSWITCAARLGHASAALIRRLPER